MSFAMHGVGVSSGIAIGHAHLVSHALLEVVHYVVPTDLIEQEILRYDLAIETVKQDLHHVSKHLPSKAPKELEAFIHTHLLLLNDHTIKDDPKRIISQEKCNAEWALKQQLESIVEQFDQIEDEYLRERKQDVIQVAERIIKVLLGRPSQVPVTEQEKAIILVAHDISPADAIQFKQHQFAAFVTDVGGATSHTAILARSLNIPSIVALHKARALVRDGDLVIVDGSSGVFIVDPDKNTLAEYKLRQEQWQLEQQKLKRLKNTQAVTLDAVPIDIYANIEVPEDVTQVNAAGAAGIGLYRTEFLFMNRREPPSEDEQFHAYREVAQKMHNKPVVIRTLDLGADKQVFGDSVRTCTNPALGLRAIRLCLADPPVFHRQLRALLRASAFGNIQILLPMLSSIAECQQALLFVERAKQSLRLDNIAFNEHILVGGMIEIPAAAICAQAFAKHLDFLSIGTNDLIQYSLAIDRTDDSVSHLYNPIHPAILHLIEMTIRAANNAGKKVSVCGEMAGDIKLTKLLLGLGLRQFSMHPAHIPSVKYLVLNTELTQLKPVTKKILQTQDALKIEQLINKLNN